MSAGVGQSPEPSQSLHCPTHLTDGFAKLVVQPEAFGAVTIVWSSGANGIVATRNTASAGKLFTRGQAANSPPAASTTLSLIGCGLPQMASSTYGRLRDWTIDSRISDSEMRVALQGSQSPTAP